MQHEAHHVEMVSRWDLPEKEVVRGEGREPANLAYRRVEDEMQHAASDEEAENGSQGRALEHTQYQVSERSRREPEQRQMREVGVVHHAPGSEGVEVEQVEVRKDAADQQR